MMAAVLYKVDLVMIKLSMKMIFVISCAACLLGSVHTSSSRGAVTMAAAVGDVQAPLVKVSYPTYEPILDIHGERVRYLDTFTMWAPDVGFGFRYLFFGLGPGTVFVDTDTEVTLNFENSVFICQDNGIIEQMHSGSAPSQKSLVRVRRNAADDTYHLQITEETPPVFVQINNSETLPLTCRRGVEGTRVQFELTSSSSSSTSSSTHMIDNGGRQAQRASEHHANMTPEIPVIQLTSTSS